ncbi:hypothetical protein D3C72_2352880 [compost metagenome]
MDASVFISSADSFEIWLRAGRMEVALMLNSSSPRPSSSGMAVESPAISPHMPVHLPWAWAASMTFLIRRRIAGL